MYQCARENPDRFFIGIDANARPLEKISEKIHRKPAKGGLPNVLFVQAAVEDLPAELNGIADEIHVQFPWGTLLGAVANGERTALRNLFRICRPGALMRVVIGIDPDRDRAEIERLGLQSLSLPFIDSVLAPRYKDAGFAILERGVLSAPDRIQLRTSWAKRLQSGSSRTMLYITAQAMERGSSG